MKFLFALIALASFEVRANNCRHDAKKFCAGVKTGEGLLIKCLHDNIDNVSKACANELKVSVSDENPKNPCEKDLLDFCGDMPFDGEKLSLCMLKNERKLSRACVDDFQKKKPKLAQQNPCANETVEHCYDYVNAPRMQLNRCLVRSRAKASPACQKNLENLVNTMKAKNSCFDEVEKYCSNEMKRPDIQVCLEKNKSKLSAKCLTTVNKQIEKMKAHPCYQDLNTICKTALTHANKMKCLSKNQPKLSPACRANQQERQNKVKKIISLCESDRVKFCSLEPKHMGRVISCLKRHKAKISPQCKTAL